LRIHSIVNQIFSSNTFIVETNSKGIIIIDPGSSSILLTDILKQINKDPITVILSHEHYDHIAGIEALSVFFTFDLICSKACEKGIRDSRQNYSYYMDEIKPYTVSHKAIVVDKDTRMEVVGLDCLFLLTPGHSPGGMCMKIGNAVFTGDTLLNNTRTPLNLFHSNKADYTKSLQKLKTALQLGNIMYPGHGQSFSYTSALIEI